MPAPICCTLELLDFARRSERRKKSMRRKLTTLLAKSGHSQNGAPRQMIDEAAYREHRNNANANASTISTSPHYDTEYSGWSNATRPRDQAISLRAVLPKVTTSPPIS